MSSRITIRQLLNHTSGLSTIDGLIPAVDSYSGDDPMESYVRSLNEAALVAPPGRRFEYTNAGYSVLGLIIQQVSGISYDAYVRAHIFEPLDMRHSYTMATEARADHPAVGHYPFFGIPFASDETPSRAVLPASGIYSTAEDMTHYLIAQLNEGRYRDRAIVSASGMRAMHAPAVRVNELKQYGMGWMVGPYYDVFENAIRHDGEGARFHAFALVVPERRIGIVWLINTDYPPTETVFSSIGWGIAETYLGRTPPAPQTVRTRLSPVLARDGRGDVDAAWRGHGVVHPSRVATGVGRPRGPRAAGRRSGSCSRWQPGTLALPSTSCSSSFHRTASRCRSLCTLLRMWGCSSLAF